MRLIKDYGKIKIYNNNGHYEIRVDGNFRGSCDNWKEVEEDLERIYEGLELNREA